MQKITCLSALVIILVPFAAWVQAKEERSPPQFIRSSSDRFANPHDIELDPTGKWLYVADTNNHIIKVLDATSLELKVTLGRGELNAPHDVHFTADGRLLVADSGNNRVIIYALDNFTVTLVGELTEGLRSPEGVTSDAAGHIFVASTGNHRILKFHQNRLLKEIGKRGHDKLEFERPHDIEMTSDGLLYVGDPGNERIQVLTDALTFHSYITGTDKPFKEPKYLAIDNKNYLYLADQQNNLLRIYNPERKQVALITSAGGKQLNYLEGVEVGHERIWVSDTYNNRILLFQWSEYKN